MKRLGAQIELYLSEKQAGLKRNALVVDFWRETLPNELQDHCSLAGISRGTLLLEVDPGPYMHEMKIMNTELLNEIRSRCPGTGIKKIELRPRKNAKKSRYEKNDRP
jgi:hypothetical protein